MTKRMRMVIILYMGEEGPFGEWVFVPCFREGCYLFRQ
jgi:hypothetical protein